jgi:putative serine protease PepD
MTQWTSDPGTEPPSFDDDPERDGAWFRPTQPVRTLDAPAATQPLPAVDVAPGALAGRDAPSPSPLGPPGAMPASPPGPPAAGPPIGLDSPPPPLYPPLSQFPSGGPPVGGDPDPHRSRLRTVAVAVVLTLLVGAIGFGLGRAVRSGDEASNTPAAATNRSDSEDTGEAPAPPAPGQDGPNTSAPALDPELSDEPAAAVNKAVSPAVVQIETQSGLGSGFIYDGQGYILTAAHVVGQAGPFGNTTGGFATDVTVRLADGTSVAGKVLGADLNNDVAVVKIDPVENMPVAALALGDVPEVGSLAIAIGSPFGLDQTVTQGIISAVNRPVASPNDNIVSMIQTDAAINSGNSGGPLVNRDGEVIGVNTQIRTETGENVGIGFAVPIDLAYDVAQALVAGEPIQLGYLGVRTEDPGFGSAGAMVTQVEEGSPAHQAGLQTGDLITEANGEPIRSFEQLASLIRASNPGDTMKLTVERDGSTEQLDVTLGQAKTN